MSTMPQPLQYQGSNDPRKIAQNQRAMVQQTGDELMRAQGVMQGQAEQQRGQVTDYLNPIEQQLARGQGGYNASELSQIQMTPQQQQQMITGAGISAGENTAAGVGAAQRAAAAAGGNPAAMAAYRARAAQQIGAQAGDAMTQARIAASNAAAQRAENIGQTRIGQQQQALGQQQNLAEMYNQNAQNAAQRALQAYGTQTSGTGQAAGLGLQASQTPTTFDKIMGGISGFLEEGDVMARDDMTPAVVGESGPEKVVNLRRQHLQDGLVGPGGGLGEDVDNSAASSQPSPANPGGTAPQPWFKQFASKIQQMRQQPATTPGAPQGTAQQGQQFNPVSTYQGMGKAAGSAVAAFAPKLLSFLGDGGFAAANKTSRFDRTTPIPGGVAPMGVPTPQGVNGVFTQPTRVNLAKNEAVVPLSYRATAKTRPSMASLPAAPVTKAPKPRPYRAPIRRSSIPAIGSHRI
jgi:hypothetical protein